MNAYTPGPGDSATWPPYTGHPTDPRGPTGWSASDALDRYRAEFLEKAADPATGARFLSDELEDVDLHDIFTKLLRDAAHEFKVSGRADIRAARIGGAVTGLLQAYADFYARMKVADEIEAMEDNCDD